MKRMLAIALVVVMLIIGTASAVTLWKPIEQIEDEKSGVTIGEKNALRVGEDYLDAMGFSYDGLIDQLMYEGFTREEAVYACDILFERNGLPVKKGSNGSKVKEVQEKLIELRFLSGGADGIFGSGTEKAVKAFQTDNGLSITGIVDEETYDALFAAEEKSGNLNEAEENAEAVPQNTVKTERGLEGYSETELRELIRRARSELEKYNPPLVEGNTLYEDEFVKVVYSEIELDNYGELEIKCTVENKSDHNLLIKMESATCNGWDFTYYGNEGVVKVSASSKSRDSFEFSKFTELTEIETLEGIEEIRYTVRVSDADSYDTLSSADEHFYLDMPVQ